MASVTVNKTNVRFFDAIDEPNQVLLPIRGYANEALLPLREAVYPIRKLFTDFDKMVTKAKRDSKKSAGNLTSDESAAIHLYTIQWKEPDTSLYVKLNRVLRSKRRELLKPWFRYMKLILTALFKLPSLTSTVWRGAWGNLSDQYNENHFWWGFSLCTQNRQVMEQFIGTSGVRTLFNIECINGKAIQAHSSFKKESEVILLPGTYFRVMGKSNPTKDLYIIHLRETTAPRPYLEPPFTSTVSDASDTGLLPVLYKSSNLEEEYSPTGFSMSAKSKKKQEFDTSGKFKTLVCNGRRCSECRRCRDWYFIGDRSIWKWFQDNYMFWSNDDRQRWNSDRLYDQFKRRDNATCGGYHAGYFYHAYCVCDDNCKNE